MSRQADTPVYRGLRSVAPTALALFLAALVPRVLTGDFPTVDEASSWLIWSGWFLEALRKGDFASTVYVGHPGITTLWLGALGARLHETLGAFGLIDPDDFATRIYLLRLPAGMTTAACVGLAYPALRRLLSTPTALLTALLWASDPFAVALSQLLHLDGLLSSFCTLALLWGMVAFRIDDAEPAAEPRRGWLIASGVAAGLALLTKSPALALAPIISLIALVGRWRAMTNQRRRALDLAQTGLVPLAIWSAVSALTWAALWPLAWVDPLRAVGEMAGEVITNGARPHETGNFFLGESLADPGPLFYPVVIALRLTPWTLAGLLLAAIWAIKGGLRAGRPLADRRTLALALLAAFALLWVAAFSALAKKHDRYILAIVPALCALAATGWAWLWAGLRQRIGRGGEALALALVVVGLGANLAAYHPYELDYYNPLLGGGPVARRSIPVGWGEGYELAMAFVLTRPDACALPLAVWLYELLPPEQHCEEMIGIDAVGDPRNRVGYVLLYVDQIQRDTYPEALARLRRLKPLHTVSIHGVELAYVYEIPASVDMLVSAEFGPAIRLRGFGYGQQGLRAGRGLELELQWEALEPVARDYVFSVFLLNDAGGKVAQIDVAPAGPEQPSSAWLPNGLIDRLQPLPVPADLPAGRYWLAMALYDPATMERLPVTGPLPPAGAPTGESNALIIGPLELR